MTMETGPVFAKVVLVLVQFKENYGRRVFLRNTNISVKVQKVLVKKKHFKIYGIIMKTNFYGKSFWH